MPRKKQAPSDAHPSGRTLSDVTATASMSASPAQRPDREPIPIKSLEFQRPVKIPGYPTAAPGVAAGPAHGGGRWSIHYIPAPHPWARHYRVRHERGDVVQERYYPAEWCSGVPA